MELLSFEAELEDRIAKFARDDIGEKAAASLDSEAERPEAVRLILGDSAFGLSSAAGERRLFLESWRRLAMSWRLLSRSSCSCWARRRGDIRPSGLSLEVDAWETFSGVLIGDEGLGNEVDCALIGVEGICTRLQFNGWVGVLDKNSPRQCRLTLASSPMAIDSNCPFLAEATAAFEAASEAAILCAKIRSGYDLNVVCKSDSSPVTGSMNGALGRILTILLLL